MPDFTAPLLPADVPVSEELLRVLLAVSLTGVIIFRPVYAADNSMITDLAYVRLNPAAQRLLQLPECPPESFLTLYPQALPTGIFGFYRDTFLSGQVESYQANYQYDNLDGYFHLVAQRYGPVLVVSFTDTNDQPRTAIEEALRQSQTRELAARAEAEARRAELQLVFAQAPVAIAILRGPTHVIELANARMGQIWGRPFAQLLGQPHFEALPDLAGQGFEQIFDGVYRTGEMRRFQELLVAINQHDGLHQGYFNIAYQPAYDGRGRITGIIASAVEVTDQVRARQQVQQLNEELEIRVAERTRQVEAANQELTKANQQLLHTNTDLDTFIYTASHDLKAPISNIEGLLTALHEELPAETQQAQNIEHLFGLMRGAVARFQQTIGQLTEVIKLQPAHAEPAESVDLAALIEAVRLDLAPTLAAARGQLSVDLAGYSAVRFSPKNLRSIVYNLLSNAIKYQVPGRPPVVQLRCHSAGRQLVLEVQDNGLGLDETQQARLFEMFRRLHTHVEGMGVGLYMVRRIVENAGGTITVQSQLGAGSTFTVALPV